MATTETARLTEFSSGDLNDLCEATEAAIIDGGGFGWVKPPPREVLESYWRGVLLVPERDLFAARLDGVICGSVQLVRPSPSKESQAFAARLESHFLAPWARGHGLARAMVETVEEAARSGGFKLLHLDVRETQTAAIRHFDALGFVRWGTNPLYAKVRGRFIAGHYYYKELS
ncbi:MAG: GNAT family N-acetyltransferase [Alphaproteobacteria bacterium]|nr:GNAT family N-acetyltransferase [Alphaproteobacteria bacterium]